MERKGYISRIIYLLVASVSPRQNPNPAILDEVQSDPQDPPVSYLSLVHILDP